MRNLLITALLVALKAQAVFGQNATVATLPATATEQTQQPKAKKIFSALLLIDTSTTLQPGATESAGEDYSQSGTYRLDLGVSLSETLKGLLRAGYSQEYSYVRDDGSTGGLIDTQLSLAKTWGEFFSTKDLLFSLGLNGILPSSKDSRKAGLLGGIGPSASIEYTMGRTHLKMQPSYVEQFHDVEYQLDGTPNIQRYARLLFDVAYDITDKWYIEGTYRISRSFVYTGRASDSFLSVIETGVSLTKNFTIAGGVSTSASFLKSNGLETNTSAFDLYQSSAYVDLVINI